MLNTQHSITQCLSNKMIQGLVDFCSLLLFMCTCIIYCRNWHPLPYNFVSLTFWLIIYYSAIGLTKTTGQLMNLSFRTPWHHKNNKKKFVVMCLCIYSFFLCTLVLYELIWTFTVDCLQFNQAKYVKRIDSYKNIFDINYIIGKETTGRFSCSHFLTSMFCYIHNFKPQFTSVLISAFFVCVYENINC